MKGSRLKHGEPCVASNPKRKGTDTAKLRLTGNAHEPCHWLVLTECTWRVSGGVAARGVLCDGMENVHFFARHAAVAWSCYGIATVALECTPGGK